MSLWPVVYFVIWTARVRIMKAVVQCKSNPQLDNEPRVYTALKHLSLKGNSHQVLLSEMSLPGVEVLIDKLLPKILGRLGKENPSKRRCKVAFVQRKCAVTSSVSVRFLYASYN